MDRASEGDRDHRVVEGGVEIEEVAKTNPEAIVRSPRIRARAQASSWRPSHRAESMPSGTTVREDRRGAVPVFIEQRCLAGRDQSADGHGRWRSWPPTPKFDVDDSPYSATGAGGKERSADEPEAEPKARRQGLRSSSSTATSASWSTAPASLWPPWTCDQARGWRARQLLRHRRRRQGRDGPQGLCIVLMTRTSRAS